MSRDPFAGYLDDPATLHRYLYTENDPVNRIDPRGRADMFETGLTLDKIAKATTLTVARLGVEVALCLFGIAETIHEFEDGNNGWGTASGAATLVACALPFVPHPPSPPGPPAPPEPPTPPPPPEPPCLNILICGGGGKGPRPPGFTY